MVSGSGPIHSSHPHRPQRLSRNELKHLDEKQLIFELVSGNAMELELELELAFMFLFVCLFHFFFVVVQGERHLQ